MATTVNFYNQALDRLIEVETGTAGLTLHLVTSSYTPSASHTNFDTDVSPYEITDSPYNPQALTGLTITDNAIDANDVTYAALSASFRYGVMRLTTIGESPERDLICWYLWDDSPADITVSNTNYVVQWSAANGIFILSRTNA